MQVREGGWVWVHARRLTVGQPRRVRAGPDFGKNSVILFFDPVFDPVPDPMQSPFPLLKSIIGRF